MRRTTGPFRGAFTLVEMLVVVTVIAVALVALLPSFSRLIESNNYASAVNTVSATLARAANRGVEGGVVFLWDPRTERMTLIQVELHNADAALRSGPGGRVPALAFRPVPGSQPATLPVGFGVYGLSMMHDDPLPPSGGTPPPEDDDSWYPGESVWEDDPNSTLRRMSLNPWLFPRNDVSFWSEDFDPANVDDPNHPVRVGVLVPQNVQPGAGISYDPTPDNPWRHLKTFFVWFGADGSLRSAAAMPAGVRDCYVEHIDLPFDPNRRPVDPDYLIDLDDRFDPEAYFGQTGGWVVFNPEVHMRPAELIAIVDMARLAEETGVRRPWNLRARSDFSPPTPSDKTSSEFQTNQLIANPTMEVRRVYDWIDRNGEIIGFNRYTGQALRR